MRRWQLNPKHPLSLQLAADARLSQTDYTNDQSWQVMLGSGDDAAIALQTQYGGRVGLASIVPMWEYDNRVIYQAIAHQSAPIVTAFAPGYIELAAVLSPDVTMTMHCWVADSHNTTGQFEIHNESSVDVALRLDLYGHVIIRNTEQRIGVLTLQDQTQALYLGKYGNIAPVVLVEEGTTSITTDGGLRAKVGKSVDIPAGKSKTIRWSQAALSDVENSLRQARYWLNASWDEITAKIEQASRAIPQIETGNIDWDATIAFSYQQAVQSLLRPTESLPNASFVTAREPINGYSRQGDGTDYIREWGGQNPTTAYLLTQALASVAPNMAEGIIRNYLAIQLENGAVDWAPGLGGQRRAMLAMPLLATMTWQVYETTKNKTLLSDVFGGLVKFFEHWFAQDVDGDGIPEWQNVTQTGYAGWTIFSSGVDITLTESPDMVTYLLREAQALQAMANELGETATQKKIEALQMALSTFWQDEHFVYRDRDTHATPSGMTVLDKAKADEEHILALPLDENSRLVIEVMGGANQAPRTTVTIQGITTDGIEKTESLDADAFVWTYGRGTAATQTVFSQVDRVTAEGLSRVYRISVRTADLDNSDMNTLLPLWSGKLTPEQAQSVVTEAWKTLLRPNGLALYQQVDEPGTDPSGIWIFWNALICEGLLQSGFHQQAVDLLKRLLRVQTATLRETGKFTLFYHEEDTIGVGTRMDIAGMVPLHVLMQVFGIRVHADGSVMVDGSFAWGQPITIRQHGIVITRDNTQTHITYPNGDTYHIEAGVSQMVSPSQPIELETPRLNLPEKPQPINQPQASVPVRIEVEIEDDSVS